MLFKNEFYYLGLNAESEIFNFGTKVWRPMSSSPIPYNTGVGASMVIWKDSLIVMGGADASTRVQFFNTVTQVRIVSVIVWCLQSWLVMRLHQT